MFGALIVDSGSGMCRVGLSGVVPRVVFPFVVGRPVLPGFMPVYATTGFLVQTVQKVVQFLDKFLSPVVVQRCAALGQGW